MKIYYYYTVFGNSVIRSLKSFLHIEVFTYIYNKAQITNSQLNHSNVNLPNITMNQQYSQLPFKITSVLTKLKGPFPFKSRIVV